MAIIRPKSYQVLITPLIAKDTYGTQVDVSKDIEIDDFVKDGGKEMWRGVPSKFVDQFKTGKAYQGVGVFGNGQYAAFGDDGFAVAKHFAAGDEKGVMRMVLPRGSKTIN